MSVREPPSADLDLVDVWVLNFPLEVFGRAQEHADGLLREFALIAQDWASDNVQTLPERLLAIVDELGVGYGGVSTEPEAERDAAIDRGEKFVDLHYRVPRAAAAASAHLGSVLDQADEYCRSGHHLLSLTTPHESLVFRRWLIGEIINQVAGAAPVPWSDRLVEQDA
jgi:hypothetical protein